MLKHLVIGIILLCPAWSVGKPNKAAPDDVKAQERLTCAWRGAYHYPAGSGQQPVEFDMIMLQDGATLAGFMKEPNTFGNQAEPFLHAVFKGKFDAKTGKVTFTKTYDGTGGQNHDVEYTGDLAKDSAKVEGSWAIGDFAGTFTLTRAANTRSGAFSGVWSGTYKYPEDADRKPVPFKLLLIHDGQKLVGLMKEPNTFGKREGPWLQAGLKGQFDEKTGKLTFTKTYDGTGGEDHDVTYSGEPSRDRSKIEGAWNLGDKLSGRFTLEKQRLDKNTLDNLK